jgi:large subunit ribosomal protein L25
MSSVETITVQSRASVGTGAARATRRDNLVPGIIYGNKKAPYPIALDARPILKELYTPGFFSKLFTISLDGQEESVLVKDVQLHPVTDHPQHIDFFRVDKNARISVNVPLRFTNDERAPGVKKGGSVNIVHHTIEVNCLVVQIPSEIVIDLGKMEINQAIHVSDLVLPENVVPSKSLGDATIVTIVAPSGPAKEETSAE